ncbi:hypothetical protein ACR30T_03760 [Neisseria gonorrhoeae]
MQIEKLTGGAVNRKDLRPDDWHLICRNWQATNPNKKPVGSDVN